MKTKVVGNENMIVCCDTSFLYSLYGNDVHSQTALKYLTKNPYLISTTLFNRFELFNALYLSEFREILKQGEATLRIADFEKNLIDELFLEVSCNLAAVLAEAQRLSAYYVAQKGYRAFDVIHVAGALQLQAKIFLTFDQQQKELARSQNLKVPF